MKKILISIVFLTASLLLKTGCSDDFLNTVPSDAASIVTLTEDFDRTKTLIVGTNRARFRATSIGGSTIHQFEYGEHATIGVIEALADDFFTIGLQSYPMLWTQNSQLHNTNPAAILVANPWFFMYRMIDNVNQVIYRVENDEIPGLTPAQRGFLLGNGLVYRAHYHHMLVKMYAQAVHHSPNNPGVIINTGLGGVALPRSTVREVYNQVIQDLNDALVALETEGVMSAITPRDGTRHNIAFASPAVVRGLLSRVYLDLHDFPRAAAYARAARVGVPLMTQAQFRDGFLTRNAEWMWGSIVPADEANNFATWPAELTNGTEQGTFYPAAWSFDNAISRQLVEAAHPEDARFGNLLRPHRTGWGAATGVNLRYDKFRWSQLGDAFDLVYMRGAEMLLNEAEALAMMGGQEAAIRALLTELLTARVNAAYAAKVTGMNNAELLAEVKMQRRKEFWGEGRRFFDLKRRGEALDRRDVITGSGQNRGLMRTVQVNNPQSGYWVYLIPTRELTNNPYIDQNNYAE